MLARPAKSSGERHTVQTQNIGTKSQSGAQGTNRGLTNSKKGHEATVRNPTVQVFRKNAEYLMCDLTTGWILESAQSFSMYTYHNMDF